MENFWKDTINNIESLHTQAQSVLAGLSQEALDWKPQDGANSLSALVMHLCGAEHYWLGAVAGQAEIVRDRHAEFLATSLDEERLAARLSVATSYAWQVLWKLRDANLSDQRVSPRDGKTFTLGWVLLYATAHTALHLGQMQLTKDLWIAKNPN